MNSALSNKVDDYAERSKSVAIGGQSTIESTSLGTNSDGLVNVYQVKTGDNVSEDVRSTWSAKGFDFTDATNNTKVRPTINGSEQMAYLSDLEKASSGYDDTEIRGLIENKASIDASNLNSTNVTSWKSKLGVKDNTEQVETIYDMNDSTKDWGYSGGISDATRINKDFSKYKKLKLYVANYPYGGVLDVDLTTMSTQNYDGIHVGNVYAMLWDNGLYLYSIDVSMPQNLSYIHISLIRRYSATVTSNGSVTKIEGVY